MRRARRCVCRHASWHVTHGLAPPVCPVYHSSRSRALQSVPVIPTSSHPWVLRQGVGLFFACRMRDHRRGAIHAHDSRGALAFHRQGVVSIPSNTASCGEPMRELR
jgi:hypothetical protein